MRTLHLLLILIVFICSFITPSKLLSQELRAVQLAAGCGDNVISVEIRLRNLSSSTGISHLLTWNDPNLTLTESDITPSVKFDAGFRVLQNALSVVWTNGVAVNFDNDEVLYTLKFRLNGALSGNAMVNQAPDDSGTPF